MDWHSKRVLVTGASGFIGSHLTERLVRLGAQVKGLVHYNSRNDWGLIEHLPPDVQNEVEIITGDLTDASIVRHSVKGADIVFHLGALIAIPYSYQAPEHYINTNIQGTYNVLSASLDFNIEKVVHTSTSETYGTAKYTPIDEEHPLQGQSPYAATKIAADKIAESFYCSFDLPVTTLRPFNTFGPRQSARAVIPTIISQALNSNKVKLGLLTPIRDLNYVENTVDAFIKIAESEKSTGDVFNAGSGIGITIGNLTEIILNFFDKKIEIVADEARLRPEKSEVMALICNYEKAKNVLDWEPKYSLEEGLQKTIEYMKQSQGFYKHNIYNH